jgi:DNA polymerase-1
MCQLVADPYIACLRLNSQVVKRKDFVPPVEYCDEAWVEKKFGVPASKVVDLLGLMGDSIDNIPGAPGIGSKGAVQLITQFGSIEEALNRWEEVKHKTYRESLHNNADLIRQSRELARIRLDLDVELDLDQIKARPPDRAAAYELFKELEFAALTREFADAATAAPARADDQLNYRIIDSRAGLDSLIKSLWDAEVVGLAVADSTSPLKGAETSGQKGDASAELVGEQQCVIDYQPAERIAFSTSEGSAFLVDFNKFAEGREAALASLREVLSNGLIEKSVHDLKRAVGLLAKLDITLEGVKDDTFLAAYLLDPNRSKYELSDLAREAAGVEHINSPAQGWSDPQWETATAADLTLRTAKVLHQRILEKKLETIYSEMELPLAPLLFRMERAGLKVDRAVLADLSNYLGLELKKLTVKIYELAGREFNIGSPKQVGEVLSDLAMTSGRKTSTGRISTSKAVLEELAQTHELPRLIIDYRELDKLKSVYTDALPHQIAADGRIHCLLNQTGCCYRPSLFERSKLTEHPDSHRTGPPDQTIVCRRKGKQDYFSRLFTARAAAACTYYAGSGNARGLSKGRRHSRTYGATRLRRQDR